MLQKTTLRAEPEAMGPPPTHDDAAGASGGARIADGLKGLTFEEGARALSPKATADEGKSGNTWADVLAGTVTLKVGMKGELVRQLQVKLGSAGFRAHKKAAEYHDGDFAASDEQAVKAFQARYGLAPTGIVDRQSARALATWSDVLGGSLILEFGDRGPAVLAAQEYLSGTPLAVPITGVFDAATKAGIERFQRDKGLEVNGKLGATTGPKLAAARDFTVGLDNSGRALHLVERRGRNGCTVRMTAATAQAYDRMAAAAQSDGRRCDLTYAMNGYRSYLDQVKMVQECGLYGAGGWAALPGTSNHGNGVALDLDDGSVATCECRTGTCAACKSGKRLKDSWLARRARDFGFVADVPGEGWHFHYVGK